MVARELNYLRMPTSLPIQNLQKQTYDIKQEKGLVTDHTRMRQYPQSMTLQEYSLYIM
jgi:hypothetical protein